MAWAGSFKTIAANASCSMAAPSTAFARTLSLVPDAKIGIALLNNLDRGFMNLALSNTLIDHLLGLPYRDWNAYYLAMQASDEKAEKEQARALRTSRKQGAKPSLPLPCYAGTYHESAYGTCQVGMEDGKLIWRWGAWRCVLDHFQDETFLANGDGFVNGVARFDVAGGKVASLKMLGRVFEREAGENKRLPKS